MKSLTAHLIICGYGWLGGYVTSKLNPTAVITGTTRDSDKASDMRARGITALRFTLGDDISPLTDLADDATLLLNIPAGRRQQDLAEYEKQMCDVVKAFAKTRQNDSISLLKRSLHYSNKFLI